MFMEDIGIRQFQTIVLLGILLVAFAPVAGHTGDVHIAYTSNLNGNLEDCQCDNQHLGGMVQLAAAIDSLRQAYPDLILLDSGDFLNTYSIPGADSLMWRLVKQMRYDAIAIGDQEFVEGLTFFRHFALKWPLPLISANLTIPKMPANLFPAVKLFKRNGIKIAVISITPPEAFLLISVPGMRIADPMERIREELARMRADADVLLLLYHDSYRHCRAVLQTFPQIDLIIAGHTQEKAAVRSSGRLILQPGMDGEYLGLVTIHQNDQKLTFRNRFIAVTPKFGKNPEVQRQVGHFFLNLKQKETSGH